MKVKTTHTGGDGLCRFNKICDCMMKSLELGKVRFSALWFKLKKSDKIMSMKRIIFGFLCSCFLFACNQSSDQADHQEHVATASVEQTQLTLNNRAKWKADSITNQNVVILKTVSDNFKIKPFPSAVDYQVFSGDLSNALNQMIQQCKMTGPDHEALHLWLEPILEQNKELKNISDTANAKRIFVSIDQRIGDYPNYFE
jgi:hypothetical protein